MSAIQFWVPCLKNQSTFSNFAKIFTHFAKISTYFARILRNFAWIFATSKLLGMGLYPRLLHR